MKRYISEDIAKEDIEIWFQDEARIGQKGTLSRTWAIKGSRPRLIRQQQFEYAYIFGGICPESGEAAELVMPFVNTQAMEQHLAVISTQVTKGKHAAIIVDRAAWHTTCNLTCPNNISIIPLPAAAPELNPVEKVWDWLRQHYLSNRAFKGYDAIVNAACEAWNEFVEQKELVHSIGSRKWAIL